MGFLGSRCSNHHNSKGLASYCKAETTFTFYFPILTLSNAFLGIDNREMKSESGFSFAVASQPLESSYTNQPKLIFQDIFIYLLVEYFFSFWSWKWGGTVKKSTFMTYNIHTYVDNLWNFTNKNVLRTQGLFWIFDAALWPPSSSWQKQGWLWWLWWLEQYWRCK